MGFKRIAASFNHNNNVQMNPKRLVKLSNIVGTVSIILLIYWVFIFISIQVFGLKVFRENITETFYMSVIGILALMFGALILNVMFNLTRIAQKHNQDKDGLSQSESPKLKWAFILSFPVVFGLLFAGDYLTSRNKEELLIQSAKSIVHENAEKADKLLNYSYSKEWIKETEKVLDLLSKTDKNFPNVYLIVKDSIEKSPILLSFRSYNGQFNDSTLLSKTTYMLQTTKDEREYLNQVFNEDFKEIRFSAHKGEYQLFYPYFNNGKKMVLYFTDFQRYGKMGS